MKRIRKSWRIRRLTIIFEHRNKKDHMGRFGGGWNWELGFVAGPNSLILNLLVFSLRFDLERKGVPND